MREICVKALCPFESRNRKSLSMWNCCNLMATFSLTKPGAVPDCAWLGTRGQSINFKRLNFRHFRFLISYYPSGKLLCWVCYGENEDAWKNLETCPFGSFSCMCLCVYRLLFRELSFFLWSLHKELGFISFCWHWLGTKKHQWTPALPNAAILSSPMGQNSREEGECFVLVQFIPQEIQHSQPAENSLLTVSVAPPGDALVNHRTTVMARTL